MAVRPYALLALFAALAQAAGARHFSTVSSLRAFWDDPQSADATFTLTGTVVCCNNSLAWDFVFRDETGPLQLVNRVNIPGRIAEPGTRAILRGLIRHEPKGKFATCRQIQVLGREDLPPPPDIRLDELASGAFDLDWVRLSGTIRDAFPDEIDPNFSYALLSDGADTISLTFCAADPGCETCFTGTNLTGLIGANVTVRGLVATKNTGSRRMRGRSISVCRPDDLSIRTRPPADPYDVPDLESLGENVAPDVLSRLNRHRATGVVRAVWNGNCMLLETERGTFVNVSCADATIAACGETVDVVGLPATDLYRKNLVRAAWRSSAKKLSAPSDVPQDTSVPRLLTDDSGRPKIDALRHGQHLRLRGRVISMNERGQPPALILESGGHTLTVDASGDPAAFAGLTSDMRISLCGICVIDIENWQPQVPFPRIRDVRLAVSSPGDIAILSRPSWWTPLRLLLVIGTLLLLLAGTLVWINVLRRIVDRRSRELLREQVSRIDANLRTDERTRLAVELHDSVAQNLTGVSLQIDAAKRFAATDREKLMKHLRIASQTLLSCRGELRNCLWDLRSHALEEPDLATAIHRTVQPHIGEADLRIRFNVPRTRLSDPTAHALFRILRELATNAVRHGKATQIRIAGSLDSGRLLFSVTDNGCGFDPKAAPGIAQGHFGIQGVSERVQQLHGTLAIESAPGAGASFRITLPGVLSMAPDKT